MNLAIFCVDTWYYNVCLIKLFVLQDAVNQDVIMVMFSKREVHFKVCRPCVKFVWVSFSVFMRYYMLMFMAEPTWGVSI